METNIYIYIYIYPIIFLSPMDPRKSRPNVPSRATQGWVCP